MRLPLSGSRPHPLWLLVAAGSALAGQLLLHSHPAVGLALFAVALVTLIAAAVPATSRAPALRVRAGRHARVRVAPLAAAFFLAAVAWAQSGDNRFTPLGVIAWLGAVGAWLWAWWPRRETLPNAVAAERPRLLWPIVPLILVLLVAGMFRFYDLQRLPPEPTSDHAEKLLDVRDVLEGEYRIFFPRNTGREPGQFYLTALIAGPLGFGLSHMALKLGTAIVGWLTVPLLYVAARRGAGAPRSVALIAAALLAVSKWHTEIARVGLRFPYAPLGITLLLVFLLRAVRLNDRRDWLLSGVALGIGLYGYTPFRIAPLLAIVALLIWWWLGVWRAGGSIWVALMESALVPLTSALVFLPLGHYALQHPDLFWYRSFTRVAEGEAGNLWITFWGNVWNAAKMFHWRGDVVWVNTVPYDPVLDPVTGALFLLGVGLLVLRVVRARRPVDALLLASLPILLLPSILALGWPHENPSVVRAGGALPVVMLIAAWPLALLAQALAGSLRGRRGLVLGGAVVTLTLGAATYLNWRTYTIEYRAQYELVAWNASEVAGVIREWAPRIGGIEHAYIENFPHWLDHRNVAFALGDPDWENVLPNARSVRSPQFEGREPRLVVVNPKDRLAVRLLKGTWDRGEHYLFESRVPSKEFWVFVHPRYSR
ncbi:MAG TPA: glycosyltransferase family 39 protein [Ardenticatenaceae bacterium]|nr:glycosyltransferase family 39 protein [Ardenticatenaceae bacterium]